MSELTLLILRIGFLLLMWLFVMSVIYALRSDLFGAPAKKMKASVEQRLIAEQQAAAPVVQPQPVSLPSQPAPPAKNLVVLTGIAAGSTVALDTPTITIGRSPDSSLVIVDEYTSTYHARLDQTPDGWTITDLDSTNGTKVSGTKISHTVPLPSHTPVSIGTTSFELRP